MMQMMELAQGWRFVRDSQFQSKLVRFNCVVLLVRRRVIYASLGASEVLPQLVTKVKFIKHLERDAFQVRVWLSWKQIISCDSKCTIKREKIVCFHFQLLNLIHEASKWAPKIFCFPSDIDARFSPQLRLSISGQIKLNRKSAWAATLGWFIVPLSWNGSDCDFQLEILRRFSLSSIKL